MRHQEHSAPNAQKKMLKSYRDLEVWKRALQLVADVYLVPRKLPTDERFVLVAQMRRASVSVSSNIAEGYGRTTRGEYLNHLSIARGSLYEVESLCEVCVSLAFLESEDLTSLLANQVHVRRLLRRLI